MIQKIVGITFNKTDNPNVVVGADVKIFHDKDNKHSDRAIAVTIGDQLLGHIGEKGNEEHEEIFKVRPINANVKRVARLEKGESFQSFKEGQVTSLSVEFTMVSDVGDGIQSFTEPSNLIEFRNDNLEHEYWYNGEKFIGGTTYIKKWIKPFDKEFISDICAKKYGCKQEKVLSLWGGTGDNSAMFGTVIHNALEHYENYKDLGEVIRGQKDLPFNKALPTHPALRKIIEDFYKLDLQVGKVMPEVLVTSVELGLCGYVDRILIIDEEKMICRVQDFKVNIDADKEDKNIKFLGQFANLPKNKLSKYQLQMSFYARLLELSGWTVEGLDAFVYEDKWKHYPLEVLKLDF